jgi:hypothetical protein
MAERRPRATAALDDGLLVAVAQIELAQLALGDAAGLGRRYDGSGLATLEGVKQPEASEQARGGLAQQKAASGGDGDVRVALLQGGGRPIKKREPRRGMRRTVGGQRARGC